MKLLRTADDLIECLENDPRRVAESMQRIGRFGGQIPGCNVLGHSLHVETLVQSEAPLVRLWALIHDVHEVLTGDVLRGWKPGQLDDMQFRIDEKIRDRFCPVDQNGRNLVDHFDQFAGDLEVEAWKPLPVKRNWKPGQLDDSVVRWVWRWEKLRAEIREAK
jgi:hypothetical protein